MKSNFQIKITLQEIKPAIWRRLLIPSTTSLPHLHRIIQVAMGWDDYHLHQFMSNGISYSIPSQDFENEDEDEKDFSIDHFLKKEGDSLLYEYDFGDAWEHKIILEKITSADPKQSLPMCLAGKRACPPEDCGGAWGYETLLKAIANPKDQESKELLEWAGEDFKPENFDLNEVNEMLLEYDDEISLEEDDD